MNGRGSERRSSVVIGGILIAVGAVFLVGRQMNIDLGRAGWPVFVIVPGIVLLLLAFAVGGLGGSGFAVAGGIVTVTGVVLAVQNQTGLWSTWAYAWALVAPGGVGLGLLVYGALTRQRDLALAGAWALLVGLALFLGFAFFFESVIGLSGGRIRGLDAVLAAGLVVLGLVIVALSLRPARRAR
jgi:hypothetical protein